MAMIDGPGQGAEGAPQTIEWKAVQTDGKTLLRREDPRTGISSTLDKESGFADYRRADSSKNPQAKRQIEYYDFRKIDEVLGDRKYVGISDILPNEVRRDIKSDSSNDEVYVALHPAVAEIGRIEYTYNGKGDLDEIRIDGRTQSKYDNSPLSLPSETLYDERIKFIHGRTLDENMGELVDFYKIRGRRALDQNGEEPTDSLLEYFKKNHPDAKPNDLARLLTEFNNFYDQALQKYRSEFPTQEEFDTFCHDMKANASIRTSIAYFITPNNLNFSEDQRKAWNQMALEHFATTALTPNYDHIEAQGDYGVLFYFSPVYANKIRATIERFQEKPTTEDVPENGVFRYGEYEYKIERIEGKTTLSIKHLMKPRGVTAKLPSHIEDLDLVKKWMGDEESESWTKVPSAIPTEIEVARG